MQRIQKIFIIIGLFIIILISVGICLNTYINHILLTLKQSSISLPDEGGKNYLEAEADFPVEAGKECPMNETASADLEIDNSNYPGIDMGYSEKEAIVNDVQQKINRPIEKTDLIKAGVIILRKLNAEEINYLYKLGQKDSFNRKEYLQARGILLKKLSAEDINTLRELGQKYGKELNILKTDTRS